MRRNQDTRFAVIEDAAALLEMLPAADEIAWPVEAGDSEAVDEALKTLSARLPEVEGVMAAAQARATRASVSGHSGDTAPAERRRLVTRKVPH